MRRKIGMLVLVFVAMIVIAGVVSLLFPATPPKPPKPLPKPNGYDAFVQAGSLLPGQATEVDTLSRDELVSLVKANSNSLEVARTGLAQECQVPLQYSESDMANLLPTLTRLKRLATAFEAEGRLAEMEGRPIDAAKSCLDTIRLGIESSRGGVLINVLVGLAVEAIGAKNLQKLQGSLDAKSCREIAAHLETLDTGREKWKDISEQEHDWVERAYPGFQNRFAIWFTSISARKTLKSTQQRFNERTAKTRRLSIEFASHAYELDHQQKPTSFADLVPAYLKTIPQDPLTGTNMTLVP